MEPSPPVHRRPSTITGTGTLAQAQVNTYSIILVSHRHAFMGLDIYWAMESHQPVHRRPSILVTGTLIASVCDCPGTQ
jgi:hypothetical protein